MVISTMEEMDAACLHVWSKKLPLGDLVLASLKLGLDDLAFPVYSEILRLRYVGMAEAIDIRKQNIMEYQGSYCIEGIIRCLCATRGWREVSFEDGAPASQKIEGVLRHILTGGLDKYITKLVADVVAADQSDVQFCNVLELVCGTRRGLDAGLEFVLEHVNI